jgi:hypothetical protein
MERGLAVPLVQCEFEKAFWCELTKQSKARNQFPAARYDFAVAVRRGEMVLYGGTYVVKEMCCDIRYI